MTKHNRSTLPKLLGYLGLIPFIVPTALLLIDQSHAEVWRHILLSYGAIILTFVGALHWSFAMSLNEISLREQHLSFLWSIVPSIIGWVALSMPIRYGFILLAIFFVIALSRDKYLSKIATLPTWYIPLRTRLTFVAASCLLTSAFLEVP